MRAVVRGGESLRKPVRIAGEGKTIALEVIPERVPERVGGELSELRVARDQGRIVVPVSVREERRDRVG